MKTEIARWAPLRRDWLKDSVLGAGALSLGGVAFAAKSITAGPLVSTESLAKNLDNAKARVIEVSVNPGVERSHIPGAVNFSWHHDLDGAARHGGRSGVREAAVDGRRGARHHGGAGWQHQQRGEPGCSTSTASRT